MAMLDLVRMLADAGVDYVRVGGPAPTGNPRPAADMIWTTTTDESCLGQPSGMAGGFFYG